MRYSQQFAITKSDTADIPQKFTDAVYISVVGDGTMVAIDDTGKSVSFAGLLVGHVYPFAVRRVLNTGTGVTVIGLKY